MDLATKNGSSELDIRPAVSADYDDIAKMWSASGLYVSTDGRDGRDAFERQCAQFGNLYLVAVIDTQVVGVVLGSHDHRKGWINRLCVHEGFRRRGIAARLIQACDSAIRTRGIEIVSALVEPANSASCALFEKLGYRTDVPVRYFRKLSRPGA